VTIRLVEPLRVIVQGIVSLVFKEEWLELVGIIVIVAVQIVIVSFFLVPFVSYCWNWWMGIF